MMIDVKAAAVWQHANTQLQLGGFQPFAFLLFLKRATTLAPGADVMYRAMLL